MSRPIPVEIIPSHVYLSEQDQRTLFGIGYPMTIAEHHSQPGQYVYKETVEVYGKLKRSFAVRILGPAWDRSHVEVTPEEAVFLGLQLDEVKSGDLSRAGMAKLVGPEGEVELDAGIIVPRPHLLASDVEAEKLNLRNGQQVTVTIDGIDEKRLNNVLVRVHPAFKLSLELHQGYARDLWITKQSHARILESV